jgi:hypothetical protein
MSNIINQTLLNDFVKDITINGDTTVLSAFIDILDEKLIYDSLSYHEQNFSTILSYSREMLIKEIAYAKDILLTEIVDTIHFYNDKTVLFNIIENVSNDIKKDFISEI